MPVLLKTGNKLLPMSYALCCAGFRGKHKTVGRPSVCSSPHGGFKLPRPQPRLVFRYG